MDYIRFIELSQFRDPKTGKVNWPAGRLAASLKSFAFSLIALASLAVVAPKVDALWTLDPAWKSLPWLLRLAYVQVSSFAARFKYYAVWKMAEGACVMSGFGYNGVDEKTGKAKWDATSNIDIWGYETGESIKDLSDSWNKGTNIWLKYSVYFRVLAPGAKPGALQTFATFAVSAFWHGFYPGYYLMFISTAITLTAGKTLRRHLRPRFVSATTGKTPRWYNFMGMLMTQVSMNYLSMPFLILTFKDSMELWKDLYFIPHIGAIAVIILVPILFPTKRKSRQEQEKPELEKIKDNVKLVTEDASEALVDSATELLTSPSSEKLKSL
ncbi:lysophospholipid acyltransferase [Haplosporangium sp. Z 27]|nr:lysophospholipid acyltransferase [Haplosporangium sp. Z 27]